ncbi:MAG TPA: transglycosylase SLT domain-containing protein [Candidatus Magasanikbacteria bacterium]|nr:transglycosylase SLT domain-containing protein [Candidatus Magasanikbacteria bacterium]
MPEKPGYNPEENLFKKILKKAAPIILAGGIAAGVVVDKNEKDEKQKTEAIDVENYKDELEKNFNNHFLKEEVKKSFDSPYSKENSEKALKELDKILKEYRDKVYKVKFADQEFFADKHFAKVLSDEEYRKNLLVAVMNAAEKYGVPYDIAMGMLSVESGGDNKAKSKKDALGIFQIISSTAEEYGLKVDKENPEQDERTDNAKSAEIAMQILSDYQQMFGQWSLALVAYNAGPGKLKKFIDNLYDRKSENNLITEKDKDFYKELSEEGKLDLLNLYKRALKKGYDLKELPGLKYALEVAVSAPEMTNILNLNLNKTAFKQDNIKRPSFFQ